MERKCVKGETELWQQTQFFWILKARQVLAVPYCSGMPCLKDVAVQLGITASRVVGHKGKLGVNRPGGGQRDPMQSVGHQECLHMKDNSTRSVFTWSWFKRSQVSKSDSENQWHDLQFHLRHTFLLLWWRTWWIQVASSGTSSKRQLWVNYPQGHEKVLFGLKMENKGGLFTQKECKEKKN